MEKIEETLVDEVTGEYLGLIGACVAYIEYKQSVKEAKNPFVDAFIAKPDEGSAEYSNLLQAVENSIKFIDECLSRDGVDLSTLSVG